MSLCIFLSLFGFVYLGLASAFPNRFGPVGVLTIWGFGILAGGFGL
jgi:hypothetical protein